VANIAASVRQRLKNLSDEKEWDYQILLRRFVLERILYRLTASGFQDEFVLKGAMLQAVWMENRLRDQLQSILLQTKTHARPRRNPRRYPRTRKGNERAADGDCGNGGLTPTRL
jgi:hypothetical protein